MQKYDHFSTFIAGNRTFLFPSLFLLNIFYRLFKVHFYLPKTYAVIVQTIYPITVF